MPLNIHTCSNAYIVFVYKIEAIYIIRKSRYMLTGEGYERMDGLTDPQSEPR